jgi:hypothetical protein
MPAWMAGTHQASTVVVRFVLTWYFTYGFSNLELA